MNTALTAYMKVKGGVSTRSAVQEEIMDKRREDAILRLALRMNAGKAENGTPFSGRKKK